MKENQDSVEIFKNILKFYLESSNLINYSVNMCWTCHCITVCYKADTLVRNVFWISKAKKQSKKTHEEKE